MPKVKTSRAFTTLRKDIRRWLIRIGINEGDIEILTGMGGEGAKVSYIYVGKKYELLSTQQADITNNLAALDFLIHSRVLGIERKIETVEQAFGGYEALPEAATNHYTILGLQEGVAMDVVEAVYKKLALKHHPDRSTGNSEEFIRIKKAYEEIKAVKEKLEEGKG